MIFSSTTLLKILLIILNNKSRVNQHIFHWQQDVVYSQCVYRSYTVTQYRQQQSRSGVMSYLHAEKARDHDAKDPEDSEEENFVHCCTVFFTIFL